MQGLRDIQFMLKVVRCEREQHWAIHGLGGKAGGMARQCESPLSAITKSFVGSLQISFNSPSRVLRQLHNFANPRNHLQRLPLSHCIG